MASKIHDIISQYKANFERVNQDERYKWEAVGCYKRNWDIEAIRVSGGIRIKNKAPTGCFLLGLNDGGSRQKIVNSTE